MRACEVGDSEFSFSFQRIILTGWLSFYRSFGAMQYRFSVKSCRDGPAKGVLKGVLPRNLETLLLLGHEDFALAGVIGLADDTFQFHAFHQRGRTVVADLQPALDVAGGRLAVALDDRNRLLEQVAAAIGPHA